MSVCGMESATMFAKVAVDTRVWVVGKNEEVQSASVRKNYWQATGRLP